MDKSCFVLLKSELGTGTAEPFATPDLLDGDRPDFYSHSILFDLSVLLKIETIFVFFYRR